ncbi:MAG TPA: hypothetical protein V6D48_05010 [Oculatellaceae cyanobacterium]
MSSFSQLDEEGALSPLLRKQNGFFNVQGARSLFINQAKCDRLLPLNQRFRQRHYLK